MSQPRPIRWYHSRADLIWPVSPFKIYSPSPPPMSEKSCFLFYIFLPVVLLRSMYKAVWHCYRLHQLLCESHHLHNLQSRVQKSLQTSSGYGSLNHLLSSTQSSEKTFSCVVGLAHCVVFLHATQCFNQEFRKKLQTLPIGVS
jgi:hypothetical protein